jgi:hypothetical protein
MDRPPPSLGLRVFQRIFEIAAVLAHASQNVVTGSVENSEQRFDSVSDQSGLQRANNRDPSAHTCFKPKRTFWIAAACSRL